MKKETSNIKESHEAENFKCDGVTFDAQRWIKLATFTLNVNSTTAISAVKELLFRQANEIEKKAENIKMTELNSMIKFSYDQIDECIGGK